MRPNFSEYRICDADIWVNLCLGDLLPRAFSVYEKLVFADVVEGEIVAWDKHDTSFSYIAKEFAYHKSNNNILIIQHGIHLDNDERSILEGVLYRLGFQHNFKNEPPEKNKGELVSAIYADHFGIPILKTNDNMFQEGGLGKKEYPDLNIMNWYNVVEDLVLDSREKIRIRAQVEQESKKMGHQFQKAKEEKKKEVALEKLMGRFNSRRL